MDHGDRPAEEGQQRGRDGRVRPAARGYSGPAGAHGRRPLHLLKRCAASLVAVAGRAGRGLGLAPAKQAADPLPGRADRYAPAAAAASPLATEGASTTRTAEPPPSYSSASHDSYSAASPPPAYPPASHDSYARLAAASLSPGRLAAVGLFAADLRGRLADLRAVRPRFLPRRLAAAGLFAAPARLVRGRRSAAKLSGRQGNLRPQRLRRRWAMPRVSAMRAGPTRCSRTTTTG